MKDVNYISHLNGALKKFAKDPAIGQGHRSLYLAFFEVWNQNRFPKKLMINSKQIMGLAKTRSRTSYLKLLHDLKKLGYLQYHPSHNPRVGSLIELFRFDTSLDQKTNKPYTVSEPLPVQNMIPFNKYNNKHKTNSLKQTKPENEQVVLIFFRNEKRSQFEAIGWRMGSKNPIINWRACAKSWILKADEIKNEQSFNRKPPHWDHLHVYQKKDYSQPL